MKFTPSRQLFCAALMLCLLAVGCSQQRTPYGQYLSDKARHDQAVALIESNGGSVDYHDRGTAVTLVLSDRVKTQQVMRAVRDLMPVDSVTLIQTGVTDWELADLGKLPTLRYLAIRDAKLTQSGVNYLEARPNITSLHLFNTGLDDYRLTNVIGKMPQLKELTIAFEPDVTNTSGKRLSRLDHLQRLTIIDTPIDREVVDPLVDTHPTIVIRYNDQTIEGPESGQ